MSITYDQVQRQVSKSVALLRETDLTMARVQFPLTDPLYEIPAIIHWVNDLVDGNRIKIYRAWQDGDIYHVAIQDDPRETIPVYAMLDIWMALYGTSHPEFDHFYEANGYAETWAFLCEQVRSRR